MELGGPFSLQLFILSLPVLCFPSFSLSTESTAAMDSEEGTQQLHLALTHKLFLLRHPDVQDIKKVRLKDEVFATVKSDSNSPPILQRFSPSHSSNSTSHYFFLVFVFVFVQIWLRCMKPQWPIRCWKVIRGFFTS